MQALSIIADAVYVSTGVLTVFLILAVAAFGCTIASAVGKCPLWVAVLILCVIELLRALPLGR
jgi:hypothetical protein